MFDYVKVADMLFITLTSLSLTRRDLDVNVAQFAVHYFCVNRPLFWCSFPIEDKNQLSIPIEAIHLLHFQLSWVPLDLPNDYFVINNI